MKTFVQQRFSQSINCSKLNSGFDMKKVISLVVLISSIAFAQSVQPQSLFELNQLSSIYRQYPSDNNLNFFNENSINENDVLQKKSAGLAILYSLLLPGMGELYAESYGSGKYFTIADGILWGTFAGFNIYGNWQKNNYESLAQSQADIHTNGKDADYFTNVGIYQNIDDYNTAMELERRFEKVYNTQTHYWKWSSDTERRAYREMWSSSEQAYTNIRFVVGALILNRVISAINAVRLVSAFNKNITQEVSWNIYFNVENKPTLPSNISLNFISNL